MGAGMEKLKILIFIAVVAACVYVAWVNIPPWVHYYSFRDDLDDIARVNSYTPRTDDEIKQIIITKARGEEIQLKEEQVTVSRGPEGLGLVVHYSVHVDMGVAAKDWDFTAQSLNKRL